MKIRAGFVTNSSSSSYLCIAKVDLTDELRTYMREEFGKFGERLLSENVMKGHDLKKCDEITDLDDEAMDLFDDDTYYLYASFIEWTNDGDTDGEDAFLYNNIPDKFMTEIYHG